MARRKEPRPCPRRLVWELLRSGKGFPSRDLGKQAERAGVEGADRALAHEILAGCLRMQGTLDRIVAAYCRKRVREEELAAALRIGAYQLLFMERVPVHAAIDTTIQAVKPELSDRASFLNGVLRNLERGAKTIEGEVKERCEVLPQPAWRFDRKVFPHPDQDPWTYLAETHGYPPALAKRWMEQVGAEGVRSRMAALNRPATLWLRVNTLRSGLEEVRQALAQAGIDCETTEGVGADRCLRVVERKERLPIHHWPGFEEGHWAVQDRTSLRSVALGRPAPGMRVLDLCAAPGGKSFAALEWSGGEAEVVACDVNAKRLETLKAEAERLGHELPVHAIGDDGDGIPDGPWDLILCDVPCSNTGVLNKRPEARWRFSRKELHALETTQNLIRKKLILPQLSPGTRVLWSTCSLEPEENQEAAARVAKHADLRLLQEQMFEPSAEQAGGYAALLGTGAGQPESV